MQANILKNFRMKEIRGLRDHKDSRDELRLNSERSTIVEADEK